MALNLKHLWALLTSQERKKFFVVLAMMVVMASLETMGVASVMPFLAVLGNPSIIDDNPTLRTMVTFFGFDRSENVVIALGLLSMFVVCFSSLFKSLTHHIMNRFVNLQRHSISARLLETYLRQPYTFFLERNSADLSKDLLSEVDLLVANVLQPAIQFLAHAIVLSATIALLLVYDTKMAITVAGVVAVLYIAIYTTVRGILGRIGPEREKANADRFKASTEAFGAIKEVKVAGAGDAYLNRFSHPSRQFSRHIATNETLSQVPLYLVEATGYSGLIFIALFLAAKGDDLGYLLPVLGLYGFAAYRFLPAAQVIYRSIARMRFGESSLRKVYHDLRMLGDVRSPTYGSKQAVSSVLRNQINYENVSYSYPGQGPTLRNVSFRIPANTATGVVGATGSGKSTMVDLLLGLLIPTEGTIKIDGVELGPLNIVAWQQAIGYVPQQIYISDCTVAENIAFGVHPNNINQAAVEKAAHAAEIHDFIKLSLPAGYQTKVGERGVRLSGGERQRIGIARAIYRDPAVLILDEATSALDSLTEQAILENIRQMIHGKTLIMIAHRLSTLRSCDKILVLKNGELVGQGGFFELFENSAYFRGLASVAGGED